MTLLWVIVAFVVVDAIIVAAVVGGALHLVWNELSSAHPAVEPAPDAVTRRFQSFSVDRCNFGGLVHVAVDETHLHLTPARPLRWLGGRATSIPWSALEVTDRPRARGMRVKIGRRTLVGPRWCLELAQPAPADVEGGA